jgi:cytidine deaminase
LSFANNDLRAAAQNAAVNFRPNPNCHVGSVGAALLAENGQIYTGACLDLPCGIGFCAEHAAVAAMLKDKQTRVIAMIALSHNAKVLPPCGRCRELLIQIDAGNKETGITVAEGEVLKLADLLPFPWLNL